MGLEIIFNFCMADIYLSVDVGGSQTKVIYQLEGDTEPDKLVLAPAVEEISAARLDSYKERKGWIGSPHPDKELWVTWNKRVVVLGDFASKFDPIDRLGELKYENALWKVLGAIGLIVENNEFLVSPKKPLKVELALLLPWNEYNDRKKFEEQLRKMLASFKVRELNLKVSLERFLCRPEGGGLAALRIKEEGVDWLRDQQLGVLMFGHRNTTALYFDRGELKVGDSPLLGFAVLLDMVVEMTSGLDRERLASAIFKARYASINSIYSATQYQPATSRPKWSNCDAIKALASAKDPDLRDKEIQDIDNAINAATSEYWSKLERWMKKVFPIELDEVIIGGGAAYYIEPELEDYFNCEPETKEQYTYSSSRVRTGRYRKKNSRKRFTPMIWGGGFQDTVKETFDLSFNQFEEQCTSARLVDCFGLFDYLVGLEVKTNG
ncbi:unknown protein (plasmid) [Calothrix sp. PCC 7716]|nr:unknown protein [Calothrix sp. PCC 7716]